MFPNSSLSRSLITSASRFQNPSKPYSSWLSDPGNPLIRWPPISHHPPNPPPPSPPPPAAAAAVLSHLLKTTAPSDLPSALLRSQIPPLPSLLESLLSSHPQIPTHSLWALSKWALPILTPTLLTSLVDALARSRSFSAAWSLLLRRLPAPLSAFAALFRRLARAGRPRASIHAFEFLLRRPDSLSPSLSPSFDPSPLDLLVDALCKENHTKTAANYIAEKKSQTPDWSPSVRCYNSLLHGWFRARKLKKAETLWEEMKKDGVQPTVVSYGTMIEGLCRMKRPDQALAFLDEMRGLNIEPNHFTCNPIVDSLAEAGRFKEALGFVERFPLYRVSPSISTYNSLVKGFCKNGELVGASRILKVMIKREILPTSTTYNYFFRYFAVSGKIEEGMNLYTKMVHSGYSPDRLTYQLLIKMLCEKEKLDLAVQVIGEMNRNGFDSDLATSTMLVHLLVRLRRFDEACGEFEGMIKKGIVPQYITYRMLAKELKRLGMDEMERKVSALMNSVPHSIQMPGTYRAKEGDQVVELRKNIIRKARVVSDVLKTRKDSKKKSKWKGS